MRETFQTAVEFCSAQRIETSMVEHTGVERIEAHEKSSKVKTFEGHTLSFSFQI